MSNVKQIDVAAVMYQQDYDERFPPAAQWMDTTLPYIKNKNTYRCPDLHSSQPDEFGHGFNTSLSLQALEKYKEPAKERMVFDSNDLHWNANAPGQKGLANPPRHAGGNTVGFADGHAKLEKLLTGEQ